MKRGFVVLMAMTLLIGAFGGCGGIGSTGGEDETELKWVMVGPGEQRDSPKVWEEFNKQLKTYPGLEKVKVNFEIIPHTEYKQKFLLMQTSGAQMDIAATYMLDYPAEVVSGTFMPLNDLIAKEAPSIKTSIPDWVFDLMKVENELYAVPNYQMMNTAIYAFAMQKEVSDKYWDKSAAEEVFWNSDTFTDACYDVLEKYLETLKENGGLNLGIQPDSIYAWKGYEDISYPYMATLTEDEVRVVNIWQEPSMQTLIKRFADWYQKGYIRKDMLSVEASNGQGTKNGYDVWLEQYWKGSDKKLSKKYNMPIELTSPQKNYRIPISAPAGGSAIMAGSKHPKEAIKVLELLHNEAGKDLYRLLAYGIEGEHYKKVGDKIETIGYIGEATASAPYGLYKYIVGNTVNAFETVEDIDGWNDYIFNDLNKNAEKSRLAGFVIDLTKIEAKKMQVNTVCTEYDRPLATGAQANYETLYQEFMGKLQKAGNDDILAELQAQVDAFLRK